MIPPDYVRLEANNPLIMSAIHHRVASIVASNGL